MIERYPQGRHSSIYVRPLQGLSNLISRDRSLRHKPEIWAKFIEDAVNAMAKVKGIPQSGKLTLLPPKEIPQ